MKKVLLTFLFYITSITIAQTVPSQFLLSESSLSKIANKTPLSNSISKIVTVGDTIWLGTSRGVSVSYDNGENWNDFYQSEAFGEESISALGYYNGIIWAATGHDTVISDQSVDTGSGIRFSTDGGETWVTIPQSVDDPGDSLLTYGINTIRALPVTVAQQNIIWDISFTPNKIWIASWAGGIRWNYIDSLIINPKQNWHRVILPPDNLTSISPSDTLTFALQNARGRFGNEEHLNHLGFSVLGVNDSVVYCGTAGGINKSTDGGVSWKKFNNQNQKNSISGNWVVDITIDSVNQTIWASTWKANGETEFYGVSKSDDGGENWGTFLRDEKVYFHGHKYSSLGSEVFLPTDKGVYRSSNNGVTFIKNPPIKDSNSSLKLLTNTFFAVGVNQNEENKFNIWLGSNDGLAKLTEDGNDWRGDWRVYISSPDISSSSEAIAFPNPFDPDSEPIKIKYSFNGGAKNVSLRIFDFGMNLVKTVFQNVSRVSDVEYLENWNGQDENNSIVPNGVYFYRIDIGDDEPLFGKIIVLM